MANQRAVAGAFGHDARTVMASWLPLYHDMGLGSVIQALYLGTTMFLLSPLQFLQKPIAWLRAISRHGVTTSGGPSFAYDFCVRRTTPEDRRGLDLASWEVAFNGAEPVRADVMDGFADAFAPAGFRREAFYPCYGLAESVVFVTGGDKLRTAKRRHVDRQALEAQRVASPVSEARSRPLVGCGRPWVSAEDEHEVKIVDPGRRLTCAPGEIGEIWIRGPSVASGYWNRSEESAQTFCARLANGDGPFLRSGDLGFVEDEELYVTGRLKDIIVIRGKKHHAEDIERTVERANRVVAVSVTAAFGVDRGGEERLVIVQEVRPADASRLDTVATAEDIREAVVHHHGVRVDTVMFAKSGSIPKTSSGKVRRAACRASYLEGTLSAIAEVT
jgi:acyl-CoA synthetase (AMP-forming)/AMP-acid ligase II